MFLLLTAVLVAGTLTVAEAIEPEVKGKTLILDKIERAPDTLSEQQRETIRGQIDILTEAGIKGLDDGSLPIVGVGTDFKNQAVKVKILEASLNDESVKIYEKKIREIIGDKSDLTIIPGNIGVFTTCSQTGDCEPLQGGVKIGVYLNSTHTVFCSMGVKASYDSKTGFVTAGHCNETEIGGEGEDVGNPTDSASDKLGTVHENAFEDDGWCDCMFVDSTETISDKVYNNIDISGELFPVVTDDVKWEGYASLGGSSDIVDNYESFTGEFLGSNITIQGAVAIEDTFTIGDSGGTVYEDVNSGTPKFAGIIMGNQDGDGFYIPYYRITNAFSGLTFTYT